jgi:hypothetical protein
MKTTSAFLSPCWTIRGLALPIVLSLVLGTGRVVAQIQYTDIAPDFIVQNDGISSIYLLDLNGDGTNDFQVQAFMDYDPPFDQVWIQPLGAVGNAVAGLSGTSSCCEIFGDPLAFNLPFETPIGDATNWRTVRMDLNCDACGNWVVGETGYIGLRLRSGANARYGWLRMTLSGLASATLLDYAVELSPMLAIEAGDTGGCTAPGNRIGESLDPTSAEVSWDSSPGAVQYQVSWRLASGGPASSLLVPSSPAVINSLLPNRRYRWAVTTLCSSDTSTASATEEFGTTDLPRPGQVRTLNLLTPGFPPAEPDGITNFANLGAEIAPLGDLNGDGIQDFAVATRFQPSGPIGGVRVILPDADGSVLLVKRPNAGPADIKSMVGLGDIDGNGAGDLALTEDLTDQVWILLLNTDGTALSAHVLQWDGADATGWELANIGDVDGNGVNDLVVRQSSGAYLFRLDEDGLAINRGYIDFAAAGISGGQFEGMAGIGDLDGDGVPDLAIGDGLDNGDASAAGAVYTLRLNLDGSVKGVQKLHGITAGNWIKNQNSDLFGRSLCAVGDLTGDGIPDLAVAAEQDNDPFSDAGSVLLIALNADGTLLSSRKLADLSQGLNLGVSADDYFGTGLAWVGDTDGDGIGELAIGAPGTNLTGNNLGSVYRIALDIPFCGVPEDAAVDMLMPNAVRLDWSDVPDATSYQIEGRKLGGAPRTATRTTSSFVRSGLLANQSYAWRIRSVCGPLFSQWTPLDTFTTPLSRVAGIGQASIYPNPSQGMIQVVITEQAPGMIQVLDATGRTVLGLRAEQPGSYALDLRDQADGLYLIKMGEETFSLILER